ncbi:hypothetical protein HDU85_002207 [Gaertneriomyces sp. JEL0708]|nr:hypothetical protein HDU85_002207 [Gaertneriomyces sp. JEL0708]
MSEESEKPTDRSLLPLESTPLPVGTDTAGAFVSSLLVSQPKDGLKTFRPEPPSELFSRLQAFLPQIASANSQLQSQSVDERDIENVDEEEQYIEMNLGVGVFDTQPTEKTEDDIIMKVTDERLEDGNKPLIELLKGDEGSASEDSDTTTDESESDDTDDDDADESQSTEEIGGDAMET